MTIPKNYRPASLHADCEHEMVQAVYEGTPYSYCSQCGGEVIPGLSGSVQPKRTELQYNLQKARALATTLRCTLEEINDMEFDWYETDDDAPAPQHELETMIEEVGMAEGFLDELPEDFIGNGSVKLTIEGFSS